MTPDEKERIKQVIESLTGKVEILVEKAVNEILEEESDEEVTKFEGEEDDEDDE